MIVPDLDLLMYILLSGFNLGIIAYNVVLFLSTRQPIYLLFSAALLSYSLGIGLWNADVQQFWPFIWPKNNASFIFDTLNVVLFTAFIKHYLILFVNFKKKHPILTRLMNAYILLGVLLILFFFVYPHPALLSVRTVFILVSCTSSIIGLPIYYATLKHLPTFVITTTLFCLMNIVFFINILLTQYGYHQLSNNAVFFSGTLFFISFSSLISKQLNTDRQQRELAQLNAIEHLEKYQQLYESTFEGFFTARLDGFLLASNPSLNQLLSLDPSALTNQRIALHTYFADQHDTWTSISHQLSQHNVVEEMEIQGLSSSWYSLSARLLKNKDATLIEGSLIDITARKNQALELAYLAGHDALTDLFNRTEFEQRLQNIIGSLQNQTLLFIDLDQFKVINDSCGHPAGDECLRQIAKHLQDQLAVGETLARLGGDEFGILINQTTEASAQIRADAIRLAMEGYHFVWRTRMFKTTVSIGVITISPEITSVPYALSLADTACYAAKAAGRNCLIVGNPQCEITLRRHSQMDMVATLNQALESDRLMLYRQAITPLLIGNSCLPWHELLVRLPMHTNIMLPGAFLPAAQRYDLMPQIDHWVFKATCAWLSKPENQQQTGLLNINVSPQTLCHPGFLIFVQQTIAEYAINPMQLCFEITEYNAINDLSQVLRHLHQLKELGIRFALDDFGSGFASFDYVKRLPVDFIKIDGQFIREICRNPIDRTLVQAVSDIAHSLGKQVIAESVEDQDTTAMLRSFGIDFGQGYYFGRPERLLPEVNRLAFCNGMSSEENNLETTAC